MEDQGERMDRERMARPIDGKMAFELMFFLRARDEAGQKAGGVGGEETSSGRVDLFVTATRGRFEGAVGRLVIGPNDTLQAEFGKNRVIVVPDNMSQTPGFRLDEASVERYISFVRARALAKAEIADVEPVVRDCVTDAVGRRAPEEENPRKKFEDMLKAALQSASTEFVYCAGAVAVYLEAKLIEELLRATEEAGFDVIYYRNLNRGRYVAGSYGEEIGSVISGALDCVILETLKLSDRYGKGAYALMYDIKNEELVILNKEAHHQLC